MTGENGTLDVAYYDLSEGRLALVGATLSRSVENGKGHWRLELPRAGEEPLHVDGLGGPVKPPASIRRILPAYLRGSKPERTSTPLEGDRSEAADAIGRLRAMLERQYAQVLRHDPGIRLDLDPEDVHAVRVAARRARAILRAARPVLDREWSEPLRDELKWLGGSLGRRRDVDVLVGHLQHEVEQLDQPERAAAGALVELLAGERERAQALAAETLESDRYYALLDALEAAARGPRVRRGEVSLRELARRECKRLSRLPGAYRPTRPTKSCTGPGFSASVPATAPSWRRPRSASPPAVSSSARRRCRTCSARIKTRSSPRLVSAGCSPRSRAPALPSRPAGSWSASGPDAQRRARPAAEGLARAGALGPGRLGMIVYLVRHARAGRRAEWEGNDRLRPLDERGRQ